ncbi:hypothetical protein DPMN_104902 [Dreissena polymorpha]|uniref:Uncharacterized protein n=1 Tax=Dreissena polymorpha TaxID=45954 RepID=A0A9D4HG63_DREPO|nr:hypothetical protein DPMN_104902 [Dreissena polymorpha]
MASNDKFIEEIRHLLWDRKLPRDVDSFTRSLGFLSASNKDLSLKYIREITDLAKSLMRKTSSKNEKQRCSTWLGKFANCLDTYQVLSREWISEHVWKLPPV